MSVLKEGLTVQKKIHYNIRGAGGISLIFQVGPIQNF